MIRTLPIALVLLLTAALALAAGASAPPRGRVKVVEHSLADDGGPFLGLGASYFTALQRCKHDRERLNRDLAFLARNGFNYYRMLSMVGWNASWDGLEIAPVAFTSEEGKRVEAWPDYWRQLRELVDLAYDRHGLRTQITIFADAQLMPQKADRIEHMRKLLEEVVKGREHKILMLEVANEAWQNGFPGDEGLADLRAFAKYLNERTEVPVAISSNHAESFDELYKGSGADLATWHFSRDRRPAEGWEPVYDCWDYADREGCPPVVSNEPIGPGSSVNAERDPLKLVMAAAFAYAAKLPAYVFHSGAGVHGRTRFEETPGIDRFREVLRLLPPDLPSWQRRDGKDATSLLTLFASGQPNQYRTEGADDGCVRSIESRRGDQFVSIPLGIGPDGLELEARRPVSLTAHNPLTGKVLFSGTKRAGDRFTLPPGPGALLILGRVLR